MILGLFDSLLINFLALIVFYSFKNVFQLDLQVQILENTFCDAGIGFGRASKVLVELMALGNYLEQCAPPRESSKVSGKMFVGFGHKKGRKGLKIVFLQSGKLCRGLRFKAQEYI